jgi:hypothetical protein
MKLQNSCKCRNAPLMILPIGLGSRSPSVTRREARDSSSGKKYWLGRISSVDKTLNFLCKVNRWLCWWFGCEGHPQDPSPPEYLECIRCAKIVPYGDMVGDTRHNRFKEFFNYWFYRKWIPSKCCDCGKRYGDHSDCIPF